MHKTTTAALAARFDVLSLALQEVVRALPPAQAAPGGGRGPTARGGNGRRADVACG